MNAINTHRRLLAIVAALLLAALATAAILSYVRGVEQRAQQGEALIGVIVARENIPAGTTADAASSRGLLGRESVPKRLAPDGAVLSVTELQGTVAAFDIRQGEMIVAGRFVAPAALAGVLPIPADRQAMSLDIDVPRGAGGFVQPGNRVSIIAKFEVTNGSETVDVAAFLIQDVPVLAVDSRVVRVPGAPATGDEESSDGPVVAEERMTLTLALTPADAPRLALALTDGEVFVTLLPPGQKPVTVPARTFANEFN